MRIVFIGPPGAGKGTQALRVASHLGVVHLSTGEVLRRSRANGEPIGVAAGKYLDDGRLVPDDMVCRLVAERLEQDDCRDGCVFDGFPRTRPQAETLDRLLEQSGAGVDAALDFVIPEEELLLRLAGRGRSDDAEATVRERLRHYAELTAPLAEYYEGRGLLSRIDAVGTPDAVFGRILAAIERGATRDHA